MDSVRQANKLIQHENGDRTIFCKNCGKPRRVSASNWKQVMYCTDCYYYVKRAQNTRIQKAGRARKRIKVEGVTHAPQI